MNGQQNEFSAQEREYAEKIAGLWKEQCFEALVQACMEVNVTKEQFIAAPGWQDVFTAHMASELGELLDLYAEAKAVPGFVDSGIMRMAIPAFALSAAVGTLQDLGLVPSDPYVEIGGVSGG